MNVKLVKIIYIHFIIIRPKLIGIQLHLEFIHITNFRLCMGHNSEKLIVKKLRSHTSQQMKPGNSLLWIKRKFFSVIINKSIKWGLSISPTISCLKGFNYLDMPNKNLKTWHYVKNTNHLRFLVFLLSLLLLV